MRYVKEDKITYYAKQTPDILVIWEIEEVNSKEKVIKGEYGIMRPSNTGLGVNKYWVASEFFYYKGDWAHNNGRCRFYYNPSILIDYLEANKFEVITDKQQKEFVLKMLEKTIPEKK